MRRSGNFTDAHMTTRDEKWLRCQLKNRMDFVHLIDSSWDDYEPPRRGFVSNISGLFLYFL